MPLTPQQAADENTPPEHLRMLVSQCNEILKNTPPEQLRILVNQCNEVLRLVAQNSSAEPELLRELASCGDKIICQAVVSNPNTPTDVLLALGEKFPGQLLENPVFSLLLLGKSELFGRDTLPYTNYLISLSRNTRKNPLLGSGEKLLNIMRIYHPYLDQDQR